MYISTRDEKSEKKSFIDVTMEGLAPDGGLYVPESYIPFTDVELDTLCGMHYSELALVIFNKFGIGIETRFLEPLLRKVYSSEVFCNTSKGDDPEDILPVRDMGRGMYLVRVSNGPTLAFKDFGLQFLGALYEHILTYHEVYSMKEKPLLLLGATSGDTGTAAIYAVLNKKRVRICILSPHSGMSPFQEGHMRGVVSENVCNLGVTGSFDDAQKVVKDIFADLDFKEQYNLGAVNSINWARIASQVVYYVYASLKVVGTDGVVDVAVPSGNFGNAYACYVARALGAPIRRIVIGTNENDVLHDFFLLGLYAPRRETDVTLSPSMDITAASNIERLLFHLVDDSPSKLLELMSELKREECIELSNALSDKLWDMGFVSYRVGGSDCLKTIRSVYSKRAVLIDPHTAVGFRSGEFYQEDGVPMLVVETAQPCKFQDTIERAIAKRAPYPRGFDGIEAKRQHFSRIPPDVEVVKEFIVSMSQG